MSDKLEDKIIFENKDNFFKKTVITSIVGVSKIFLFVTTPLLLLTLSVWYFGKEARDYNESQYYKYTSADAERIDCRRKDDLQNWKKELEKTLGQDLPDIDFTELEYHKKN